MYRCLQPTPDRERERDTCTRKQKHKITSFSILAYIYSKELNIFTIGETIYIHT